MASSTTPPHTLSNPPPPPPPPKTAAPPGYTQSSNYRSAPAQPNQYPPPLPPTPYDAQARSGSAQPSHRYPQTQEHEQSRPMLPEEGWVPDVIKDMHKTDLAHLLQQPTLLHALLHDPTHAHESLRASTSALSAALERTASLASQAEGQAAALERQRGATTEHLLATRAAEQGWRRREADMEGALAPFAPRALHARLGQAIAEQEEVCLAIEEGWVWEEGVASEREVGEWIRRVREGRRLLGLRRERKARWDEGRVGGWR